LKWGDIEAVEGGGQVHLLGKGDKARTVRISSETLELLETLGRGEPDARVFPSNRKDGPLSRQAIAERMRRCGLRLRDRQGWWWLLWRTGEETPPSTPLSHGVKATAQVLALALTLWRCQLILFDGFWPRGETSGTCSPAPWTSANPVLPYRCAPPPLA